MYSKKPIAGKHNFRIKLLSGNNVVLVEADGYETEIFVPEMQHGRITFQNIVPNRRCCYQAQLLNAAKLRSSRQMPGMASNESTLLERKPLGSPTNINKFWRMTAGQDINGSHSKMASSAPTNSTSVNAGKENMPRQPDARNMEPSQHSSNRLSSPAPVSRRSSLTRPVPEQPSRTPIYPMPPPLKVVKDTLVQIPPGIRVIRLYRNSTSCRVVGRSDQRHHTSRSPKRVVEISQITLPPTSRNPRASAKHTVTFPSTSPKCRKPFTPIRTFVRHAKSTNRLQPSASIKRIVPSCISNSTHGLTGTHQLDVRRRKLIDANKIITPRSIKKRLKTTFDIDKLDNSVTNLPSSRSEYERSKSTAFDLLTNSNRSQCSSSKLSQQFSQCCVNKINSTCPKADTLCTVPPFDSEEAARMRRQNAFDSAATALAERAAAQVLSLAKSSIATNSQKP